MALWGSLTALRKKSSGFRPIAVGDVLRRLAKTLCCSAARPSLPDIFLSYKPGRCWNQRRPGGGSSWFTENS